VYGSMAATNLSNGAGAGNKFSLGSLQFQDTTAHGSTFAGGASYVTQMLDTMLEIFVDKDDLAVGKAIPTGFTAFDAESGLLHALVEWVNPGYELDIPLFVQT